MNNLKLNTYHVVGKYRLWDDETLRRESFNRVVMAFTLSGAIQSCLSFYREAEIISVALRDEDVLFVVFEKEDKDE